MQVLVSHGSLLGSCKTGLLLLFTHFHQNLGRVQGEIKTSLCKIQLLHREVNIVAVRGALSSAGSCRLADINVCHLIKL